MPTYENQIIGGTSLDTQGERIPKDVLERMVQKYRGKKMPMHVMHDMANPSRGYSQNIRLIPSRRDDDEWDLIADIVVEEGVIGNFLKGFSISFTDVIRSVDGAELGVFIPFPHYNNYDFMTKIMSDESISVGRWVKKSADPATVALIFGGVAFFLRPMWDVYYKERIAPLLSDFWVNFGETFEKKGLSCEYVQFVLFEERKVEVRFLASPTGKIFEEDSDTIKNGFALVEKMLIEHKEDKIVRIVLTYDLTGRCYYISRKEDSLD